MSIYVQVGCTRLQNGSGGGLVGIYVHIFVKLDEKLLGDIDTDHSNDLEGMSAEEG